MSNRETTAVIAAENGWTVHEGMYGSNGLEGEMVAYERYSDQILIVWAPQGAAIRTIKNHQCPDEVIADGLAGLLMAHQWMKEPR